MLNWSHDSAFDKPHLPEGTGSVLDLGCGTGNTWRDFYLSPNGFACGIDRNVVDLHIAQTRLSRVCFVCGVAENLPFTDHCFNYVFSRVAFPYLDIPRALTEVHRVLKPGGRLWMSLHPASMIWGEFLASCRSLNFKNMIFRPYIILNGLLFHTTGNLARFPVNGRLESFQTRAGMERALRATGFTDIKMFRTSFFIVTARVPVAPDLRSSDQF